MKNEYDTNIDLDHFLRDIEVPNEINIYDAKSLIKRKFAKSLIDHSIKVAFHIDSTILTSVEPIRFTYQ